MLVFTRFCVSLCCCANSHFSICAFLRVILLSANITVPYRTCHPVKCQYYSAISYVSSCQVPILQCHILRVILSSANITVPYRAFFLPSVNITVPHSTCHPVECQYYSAISYVYPVKCQYYSAISCVSSCQVPILQCHIVRSSCRVSILQCHIVRLILSSVNITVPYRTCHPVECQYISAIPLCATVLGPLFPRVKVCTVSSFYMLVCMLSLFYVYVALIFLCAMLLFLYSCVNLHLLSTFHFCV